jgi:hypothetical protein
MFSSLSVYPNLLSLFHWFSHKILRRLFSETYSLSFLRLFTPSLVTLIRWINDFWFLLFVLCSQTLLQALTLYSVQHTTPSFYRSPYYHRDLPSFFYFIIYHILLAIVIPTHIFLLSSFYPCLFFIFFCYVHHLHFSCKLTLYPVTCTPAVSSYVCFTAPNNLCTSYGIVIVRKFWCFHCTSLLSLSFLHISWL